MSKRLLTVWEMAFRQMARDDGFDPDKEDKLTLYVPGGGKPWRFIDRKERERLEAEGITFHDDNPPEGDTT